MTPKKKGGRKLGKNPSVWPEDKFLSNIMTFPKRKLRFFGIPVRDAGGFGEE